MVKIFKDTSGKTYAYEIYKGKKCIMISDGYNTPEDIIQDLDEIKESIGDYQIED